jgi:lipopolysaccharide heptosyltransferase II
MGSLGDIARGLCVAAHIKKTLPDSRITWLVEPKWVKLVEFHPSIDNVIVFNRALNIFGVIGLFRELRKKHFDITLDLQRHLKSGFFSFLSRAKRRIGFNRRDTKELNWIFNNEHIDFYGDALPKFRHYLKFNQYIGMPNTDTIDFGLSSIDTLPHLPQSIAKITKPFVAVIIGSSWQSKDWLFEHYIELIRNILSSGKYAVVLLGDGSKQNLADDITHEVSSDSLVNMVHKTSLIELIAILKKASAAVGPDSGPGHLSAAVGTPYISLFGPTLPSRVVPYGCEHLAVQTCAECAPCNKRKCADHEDHCMRLITAKEVFEKLNSALS